MAKRKVSLKFQAQSVDTMSMSPGFGSYAFRPNNYRRCYDFLVRCDTACFDFDKVSLKGIGIVKNGEVTLLVGPHKVTAIMARGDRWFEVRGVPEVVNGRIRVVEEGIKNTLDRVVKSFVEGNGLVVGEGVWVRKEFALKGDDFLDGLPEDLIIHDSVFKKVYGNTTEFKSDRVGDAGAFAKVYIKNRALEDLSPEFVRVINELVGVSFDPVLWARRELIERGDMSVGVLNEVALRIPRSFRPELLDWWMGWVNGAS
jgi:hypothetical protein